MNWHQLSVSEVLSRQNSTPQGLSFKEAAARLEKFGPNQLQEKAGNGPLKILWEQLTATMVLILIGAAVISGFLGKWQEASAIFAIVLLFALLGFFQEYRAEKTMASLKKLAVPRVLVRRDGEPSEIAAHDLAPGDIILLEAGNHVPADLRLLETANLRIQESILTGESQAVEKSPLPLEKTDSLLGDRINMAYMGTTVTYGRGTGIVVATGMRTELGTIAGLLQTGESELTPLQKRLDQLGKTLALIGIAAAALLSGIEIIRGSPLVDAFLLAVSVAVAVIPEGLPAVVTITLALGARRMLARNALIRKLPAVETLGSVTTICSDKTGTLTENRMTVTVLDVAGHRVEMTGEITPRGMGLVDQTAQQTATPDQALYLLLVGGALCNDACLRKDDSRADAQRFITVGDPTETALIVAAARFGYMKSELDQEHPRVAELPFDSDRKRMSTLHSLGKNLQGGADDILDAAASDSAYISFTKGAVDGLLDSSTHIWDRGARRPISADYRRRVEESNRMLASDGMRVLGVAFRTFDRPESVEALEKDLTFIGFMGITDPPRAEAKRAVAECRSAGIRPVMITGDHPLTALHISRELGIADDKGLVMTGTELNKLDDEGLWGVVESISVFARVSPEHKLRIVKALQKHGHVAAMTGDGVNDAPALKIADIGLAMGITGTDVAKEASKIVLLDDNFSTIVAAVKEGRVIYDNLRKFVKFSIGGNLGKIIVMLFGVTAGLPTPLLPLQLLWLNLLTDGLLGVGLGLEPAEQNVMKRAPVSPQSGIFSGGAGGQIVRIGTLIGALTLAIGVMHHSNGHADWQTMMFTTLAFAQVWQAIGIRSGNDSILKVGLFSNKPLLGLILLVITAQLAAVYVPALQNYLKTSPLSAPHLLLSAAAGAIVLLYAEIEKKVASGSKKDPMHRGNQRQREAEVG